MTTRTIFAIMLTLALLPMAMPAEAVGRMHGECTTAAYLVRLGSPVNTIIGTLGGPNVRFSEPYEVGNYVWLGNDGGYRYEFSGETNRFACGLGEVCADSCEEIIGTSATAANPSPLTITGCEGVALSEPIVANLTGPNTNFPDQFFVAVGSSESVAHYGVEFYRGCDVASFTDVAILISYIRVAPKNAAWTSFGYPNYFVLDLLVTESTLVSQLGFPAKHGDFSEAPPLGDALREWNMVEHGSPPGGVSFNVSFESLPLPADPNLGGVFNRHHFTAQNYNGPVARRTVHHEDTFVLGGPATNGTIISSNSEYESARDDDELQTARGHVFANVDWTYGTTTTPFP